MLLNKEGKSPKVALIFCHTAIGLTKRDNRTLFLSHVLSNSIMRISESISAHSLWTKNKVHILVLIMAAMPLLTNEECRYLIYVFMNTGLSCLFPPLTLQYDHIAIFKISLIL